MENSPQICFPHVNVCHVGNIISYLYVAWVQLCSKMINTVTPSARCLCILITLFGSKHLFNLAVIPLKFLPTKHLSACLLLILNRQCFLFTFFLQMLKTVVCILMIGWLGRWKELHSGSFSCSRKFLCSASTVVAQSIWWGNAFLQEEETVRHLCSGEYLWYYWYGLYACHFLDHPHSYMCIHIHTYHYHWDMYTLNVEKNNNLPN